MSHNEDLGMLRCTGKNEKKYFLAFVLFVFGMLFFYITPDWIIFHRYSRNFSIAMSEFIPSILVYSNASPAPERVALFMAINWCLIPVYFYFGYKNWALNIRRKNRTLPMSKSSAWLSVVVMLVLVLGAVFLPNSVDYDTYAIRPSRQWNNWMHESLFPNGILAIFIPYAINILLLSAWLFATLPCQCSSFDWKIK